VNNLISFKSIEIIIDYKTKQNLPTNPHSSPVQQQKEEEEEEEKDDIHNTTTQ
jgi:hypothetical protein